MQGCRLLCFILEEVFCCVSKVVRFSMLEELVRSWSCRADLYSSRSSRRLRFSWSSLSFSLVRSLLQSSRTLEVIRSALYCSWSRAYPGSRVSSSVFDMGIGAGVGRKSWCWVIIWAIGCGGSFVEDWCEWDLYSKHVSSVSGHCVWSCARYPGWE